ncbi:hypothetical protein BEWA_008150 [Theileria equi strain WA]|uniref:AMP-dependent synthetase/ligase domain-containing protein n=1 Tax=Theileria equi strain WA TaxID=1537102 RepID=L0B0S9_THEEQ|nr:hypothetical protein BEWA_008150 [Theileria equi strain WA]AFZ81405.1 hypothetical protein BEWA_008150 [Theileria equi strain WA]|eukprot:XP_004831071.1 hypothetical protein BEWA_008150 [Theileria equi strain WA]
MAEDVMFFHFHNLQDDFIKYYQSTNKYRIDQVKLSRLSILFGASALYRRIQSIFPNEEPQKIVICAHLKHSKIHDFYIIAASLIYGYPLFHSNWHRDGDESLSYKIQVAKCRLVILDDDMSSEWMIPDVKYIKISDIYTQSIYNKSLSLCNYLSLVDSLGKEKSDSRIQVMLANQTKHVSEINMDDLLMISFTEGKLNRKPKARLITYGEMFEQFKELESLNMWTKDEMLVIFITNPTYDWITSTVLYYSLYRPNVYVHFLQRYMTTYWKILWEANEHSKNLFLQLGKSYKVLNFLYPRQLEALFTLEEVANECLLFMESTSELAKNRISEGLSTKMYTTPDFSKTLESSGNISDMGSSLLEKSRTSAMDPLMKNDVYRSPLLDTRISGSSIRNEPSGTSYSRNQSSPQFERTKNSKSVLYIPKLHLKFSELRSVLSDKNVHFFLSGTHTEYSLCEMFFRMFGGKMPVTLFGSNEITPIITLSIPSFGTINAIKHYKKGVSNTYAGKNYIGHYIGTPIHKDFGVSVVKSIDPKDPQYMSKCSEGEPGFIVCKLRRRNQILLNDDFTHIVTTDGTYLGLDDIGFYYKSQDGEEHFYWTHTLNASITRDLSYPYDTLISTSKTIQKSICLRYGLTSSVVRVETMKITFPGNETRIITVVELITVLKPDISQDLKSGFLRTCSMFIYDFDKFCTEAVGLFTDQLEPDEIRVISIPWTYKGSVNYAVLGVSCSYKFQRTLGHPFTLVINSQYKST